MRGVRGEALMLDWSWNRGCTAGLWIAFLLVAHQCMVVALA